MHLRCHPVCGCDCEIQKMKVAVILLLVTYAASTVVDAQCPVYVEQPMQMFERYNFTCTPDDTSGGTPLGFQCIEMTYPEHTMDINEYPCFTVNDVTGRHIEVLIEPVNPIARVRTCIQEDGFTEQCDNAVNNYCQRIQGTGNSALIHIYCLTGGCEMSSQLLWVRIVLSPPGEDSENWCLGRSQDTPSVIEAQQPTNRTHDFDQDGDTNRRTDVCDAYESQPMQMFTNYTCTLNDTSGGTPLGFQCISMTYPGLTMDINQYPCYTVYNVTGRHVEVLIEPVNSDEQVRTCIQEDGFSEQCANGTNHYCKGVQSSDDSTIIRIYCLTGGCEMNDQLLWFRIALSPPGENGENWCSTRSQATPSSLNTDQTLDNSFGVLQPAVSAATLFLIVMFSYQVNVLE